MMIEANRLDQALAIIVNVAVKYVGMYVFVMVLLISLCFA